MKRSKSQIERLIRGALGEIKADLIVTRGRLINVYSGEILEGMEFAVLDGRVCYVGESAAHTRGDRTEMLNARGLYVSPGFSDAHTHIGHFCRPYEHLQAYLPHGTTSLVASCDEHSTVFGYQGVKLFLDEVWRATRSEFIHWCPWQLLRTPFYATRVLSPKRKWLSAWLTRESWV